MTVGLRSRRLLQGLLFITLWATVCSLPLSETLKQVFFVATLMLWGLDVAVTGQLPHGEPGIAWSCVALVIWTIVSALHAPQPWLASRGVWDVLMSTGTFFFAVAVCTTTRHVVWMLYAVLLSIGLGDLVGLYGYLTMVQGSGIPSPGEARAALVPASTGVHAGQLGILSLGDPRATAQYLVMTLALQLGLYTAGLKDRLMRFLVWVTTPLTVIALVLTYGRAMWISALCIVALFVWLHKTWRVRLAGAGVLAIFLLVVGLSPSVQHRAESLFQNLWVDGGLNARLFDIWPVAWRMIQDHPVAGLGPEGFSVEEYRQQYRLEWAGRAYNAHSLWLQIGVETGLVGLLLFLVLVGSVARVLVRTRGQLRDEWSTGLWYSVLGCVLTILVGGATSLIWASETSMIVMLLVGLLCASSRPTRPGWRMTGGKPAP